MKQVKNTRATKESWPYSYFCLVLITPIEDLIWHTKGKIEIRSNWQRKPKHRHTGEIKKRQIVIKAVQLCNKVCSTHGKGFCMIAEKSIIQSNRVQPCGLGWKEPSAVWWLQRVSQPGRTQCLCLCPWAPSPCSDQVLADGRPVCPKHTRLHLLATQRRVLSFLVYVIAA